MVIKTFGGGAYTGYRPLPFSRKEIHHLNLNALVGYHNIEVAPVRTLQEMKQAIVNISDTQRSDNHIDKHSVISDVVQWTVKHVQDYLRNIEKQLELHDRPILNPEEAEKRLYHLVNVYRQQNAQDHNSRDIPLNAVNMKTVHQELTRRYSQGLKAEKSKMQHFLYQIEDAVSNGSLTPQKLATEDLAHEDPDASHHSHLIFRQLNHGNNETKSFLEPKVGTIEGIYLDPILTWVSQLNHGTFHRLLSSTIPPKQPKPFDAPSFETAPRVTKKTFRLASQKVN